MSTPARQQYLSIKAQHQDALLAYQVGDFFEFFDEDARIVARDLRIVLTSRAYGEDERVPLAGVPVHAVETYLARLVAAGHRVALCEQTSAPGRGLVQRAVTRVVTPGTVVDPGILPATRDNYLVAVALGRCDALGRPRGAGLACVEVSTGAFSCAEWPADDLPDGLCAELQRLAPAEVLVADGAAQVNAATDSEHNAWQDGLPLSRCPVHYFDAEHAHAVLCRHFATATLAAFGCEHKPLAASAAGAIVQYLGHMNPPLLRLLTSLQTYDPAGHVEIDGRTWRALEVVSPSSSARDTSAGLPTLQTTLDMTCTPMGARLLRRMLLQPLKDRAELETRLDAVEELVQRAELRERVQELLEGLGDVERLIARVVHGTAVPRELQILAGVLARVPALALTLRDARAVALRAAGDRLDVCAEASALVERAVADPTLGPRRLICQGYDAELDTLIESIADARHWIASLEVSERQRTGIRALKVGYNKVFGYYIEVSRANLDKIPDDYQRRQTLATGERYVTTALKEHEALVLHAEEQIDALERALYATVLSELATMQARLRATAAVLAQLDVWLSLGRVAVVRGYTRPVLTDTSELAIEGGRHPIVEATLDGEEFIANDLQLGDENGSYFSPSPRVMLLTGPNMAGKSTYLRQVGIIVLMAQVGSFVPARAARIGLVDRIFTRVGADDDLARGLSTFMLEMVETAYILHHATARSLVILDEVGRGTSTRDGLAIARAVIEHLHDRTGARTLFATHYHELAQLTARLGRLALCQMAVAERDGRAVFLHRVQPGASAHSYGVQVARMAGLPETVLCRAGELLEAQSHPAESSDNITAPHMAPAQMRHRIAERPTRYVVDDTPAYVAGPAATPIRNDDASTVAAQLPAASRDLALTLVGLNVAGTTPMEALNLLFSLQQRARELLGIPNDGWLGTRERSQ